MRQWTSQKKVVAVWLFLFFHCSLFPTQIEPSVEVPQWATVSTELCLLLRLLTPAPAFPFPLPLLCSGSFSPCFSFFSGLFPALASLLPLLVPCQLWHLSFSGISSCLVAATLLKYVFAEAPYAPPTGLLLGHQWVRVGCCKASWKCPRPAQGKPSSPTQVTLQPLLLPKPYSYAQYSESFQLYLYLMCITWVSLSTLILLTSSASGYGALHLSELSCEWKLRL